MEQGIERGIEQGSQQEARSPVLCQLTRKFSNAPEAARFRINELSTVQLEALVN